jgi:hypothetical protein
VKCLNKIWKSILSLLLFLLAFTQIDLINAKENENIPREIEMLFSGLDDNESVIELPNGGYIYGNGEVKIFDYLDYIEGKLVPIETYDLNKDINKITVEDAKQQLYIAKDIPMTRGSSVPTQVMQLSAGQIYISKAFSGSGWRFSGYQFVADPNTGYYLKWTTYIDDGRVGSASYANDTLRGQTHGIEIYKGQPKYISYGPNGQIYYTYNPINGTYYRVENN